MIILPISVKYLCYLITLGYLIIAKRGNFLTLSHLVRGRFLCFYSRWKLTIRPENTMDTVDTKLIRMFREGPEVSLKGSPTVSPMTAALCCSEPLPPWWPDSVSYTHLDVYKRQE